MHAEHLKSVVFDIEERLILHNPTPQTALDIFKGTWISSFPGEFSQYNAGNIPLFEDIRILESTKFLGPIEGKSFLDLGPLEGGQAYVLEKMGARSIVSVEANAQLYLKCLIVKEILGMQRVRFLCGDVIQFLKNTSEKFDVGIASGILYHMDDPVELLSLLSQKTDKLMIWTHYFCEEEPSRNKINSFTKATMHTFQGETYRYYRQEYGVVFASNTFCGGTASHSNWMSKEGIMIALQECGYSQVNVLQDGDSINGPFMLITATKQDL
jgi:hypothetical protein